MVKLNSKTKKKSNNNNRVKLNSFKLKNLPKAPNYSKNGETKYSKTKENGNTIKKKLNSE